MKQEVNLKKIKINDLFWSKIQDLVTNVVIPYQEKILNDEIEGAEKSHAFANFRIAAGLEEGEFYGMVFQDSDVAKWLEGVAYSLIASPDAELEKRADEIINVIEKAQLPDGYLNTYFTIKEPEHRWQNLHECHELYCAGHMMEAAAAYYEATGKDKLLKVMERMADHISEQFGPDKKHGIPGHEEVEIGLMRLYSATGKEKYYRLAEHFINERGQDPEFFLKEREKRGWAYFNMDPKNSKYTQSFAPVRDQKTAEGHSVRAVYLYTAMAEIAAKTGEKALINACNAIWENITQKRMYVTGGIGSTVEGEAFTMDYDLPNDTVYAETCASIGLVFFARRMLDVTPSGKYADVIERALYNGILSGMQLDGKRFFYVNPLEVNPEISGKLFGYRHVLPQRPSWYVCACCPPNVVRLMMSLGKYAWGQSDHTIYSHFFVGGRADFEQVEIQAESYYPWDGKVVYRIYPKQKGFILSIHIPEYVREKKVFLNGEAIAGEEKDGYLYIDREWEKGDRIELLFPMTVRKIYCNTAVRENEGCIALMRGPLVYCLEGIDNGELIQELRIMKNTDFVCKKETDGELAGLVTIEGSGKRLHSSEALYSEENPEEKEVVLKAVPYFAWGNRGLNQMRVWIPEK